MCVLLHQIQRVTLEDVVVCQRAVILEQLIFEAEVLVVTCDALLQRDQGLDVADRVSGHHGQGDDVIVEEPHEDRHDLDDKKWSNNKNMVMYDIATNNLC